MTAPVFPAISFYNGGLELLPADMAFAQASLRTVLHGQAGEIYANDGAVWTYVLRPDHIRLTPWIKFWAWLFYDPTVQVSPIWTRQRQYAFQTLQQHVLQVIADDDDLLTQYISAADLQAAIQAATTFETVWEILWQAQTEPDPSA